MAGCIYIGLRSKDQPLRRLPTLPVDRDHLNRVANENPRRLAWLVKAPWYGTARGGLRRDIAIAETYTRLVLLHDVSTHLWQLHIIALDGPNGRSVLFPWAGDDRVPKLLTGVTPAGVANAAYTFFDLDLAWEEDQDARLDEGWYLYGTSFTETTRRDPRVFR